MEKKQLAINGYVQNVYRVGTTGRASTATTPITKTYVSLEKRMLPNGFVQELVEKDYPITSKSVTSFADAADYRNDPAQAVANSPQRVNLGNIVETQQFLNNPQNNARIMSETLGKLKSYYDSLSAQQANIEKAKTEDNGGNKQ